MKVVATCAVVGLVFVIPSYVIGERVGYRIFRVADYDRQVTTGPRAADGALSTLDIEHPNDCRTSKKPGKKCEYTACRDCYELWSRREIREHGSWMTTYRPNRRDLRAESAEFCKECPIKKPVTPKTKNEEPPCEEQPVCK